MKHLMLVAAMALLYVGARQGTLPQLVKDNDAKLQAAKSFTAKYTVQPLGEAAVPYTLVFAKPNRFKVSWDGGFWQSDGKTLYSYTAKDNTWTETPLDDDALKAFADKPEVWGWSSFFLSDNLKGIAEAKVGGNRTVKGNPSTQVDETFTDPAQTPATVYIDQKLGLVRSYHLTLKESKELLVMATDMSVTETPDDTMFTFAAPSGAKKVDVTSASAATFAAVQQILNDNCMPCHSATGKRAGFDFTNYAGVSQAVTPGNAAMSIIVKSLKGDGVKRMPLNRAALSDDKIKTVSDWINGGAKQ